LLAACIPSLPLAVNKTKATGQGIGVTGDGFANGHQVPGIADQHQLPFGKTLPQDSLSADRG